MSMEIYGKVKTVRLLYKILVIKWIKFLVLMELIQRH